MAAALVRGVIGVTAFNLAYVLQIFLAGIFAGFSGSLFVDLGFGYHMDKIIVGALLPLYPGVTLTNAVRDFISGDLLSGTLRMVEGLLIAAALANGVGAALSIICGIICFSFMLAPGNNLAAYVDALYRFSALPPMSLNCQSPASGQRPRTRWLIGLVSRGSRLSFWQAKTRGGLRHLRTCGDSLP